MTEPIRVIQWATGSMGKACLRAVLDDPRFRLVGLFAYGEDKVGRDAGDIARREPTGVIATRSIGDILALDADVVLHCPRLPAPYTGHDVDVQRLLESGKNVISINHYFEPEALGSGYAADLHASGLKGRATLAGTGVNPGWVAERMAANAAALCLSHRNIATREIIDCTSVPSPEYVFGSLGFGSAPEAIDLKNGDLAQTFTAMFSQSVAGLAARLDVSLDGFEPDHEIGLASRDLHVAAGLIPQGTVSATTWRVHGLSGGQRRITHSVSWIMDPSDPVFVGKPHWEIEIDGLPGVRIAMDLVDTAAEGVRTKPEQFAVAAMVLKAIPRVVAGPPGLMRL
jgi:2,4-diaminopentanoate dehydrogenase